MTQRTPILVFLAIFLSVFLVRNSATEPDKNAIWKEYQKKHQALEALEKEKGQIDIQDRLELGTWCVINELKEQALAELLVVLKREPEHKLATELLNQLGYVKYYDKWITIKDWIKIEEEKAREFLQELKSEDKNRSLHALAKLKEVKPVFKIRSLIDALRDPQEYLRHYAVSALTEIGDPVILPYLVRTSLEDENESIRELARDVVKSLDIEESFAWYGYFMEIGNGIIRARGTKILTHIDNKKAVGHFIRTMGRIQQEIKATLANPADDNPLGEKSVPPQTPSRKILVSRIGSNIYLELPDIQTARIKTQVEIPAGYSLEEQLHNIVRTLGRITGQEFGKNHEKWLAWWKKNSGGTK